MFLCVSGCTACGGPSDTCCFLCLSWGNREVLEEPFLTPKFQFSSFMMCPIADCGPLHPSPVWGEQAAHPRFLPLLDVT